MPVTYVQVVLEVISIGSREARALGSMATTYSAHVCVGCSPWAVAHRPCELAGVPSDAVKRRFRNQCFDGEMRPRLVVPSETPGMVSSANRNTVDISQLIA